MERSPQTHTQMQLSVMGQSIMQSADRAEIKAENNMLGTTEEKS